LFSAGLFVLGLISLTSKENHMTSGENIHPSQEPQGEPGSHDFPYTPDELKELARDGIYPTSGSGYFGGTIGLEATAAADSADSKDDRWARGRRLLKPRAVIRLFGVTAKDLDAAEIKLRHHKEN
jgi:hypothetical protein